MVSDGGVTERDAGYSWVILIVVVLLAEMLKPRGQTGLEAKILASASGPFGLGLKLLVSASNFNI